MFTHEATRWVLCLGAALGWALGTGVPAWAWAWPVDGPVLRPFSLGGDPYAAGQHRGVDVAVGASHAIRAPASGRVSFAGPVPTHGLTVTIETGDGYKVSLTHLGPLHTRQGATVAEGAAIADPGPSGEAEHDVSYVHLGIRVGDGESYIDPLELLPPRDAPNPPPAPAAPPASSAPPASAPPISVEQPTSPSVSAPPASTPAPEPTSTPPTYLETADVTGAVAATPQPGLVVVAAAASKPSVPRGATKAPRDGESDRLRTAAVLSSAPAKAGAGKATSRMASRFAVSRAAVPRRLPATSRPGGGSARTHTAAASRGNRATDPARRSATAIDRAPADGARAASLRRALAVPRWIAALLALALGAAGVCAYRSVRKPLPIIGAREQHGEAEKKILVAVAWPYASGLRHIGHVAGFGVPSDTFARYHRLRGNDVLMVSGTDEHGTPVMVAADAAGESPRETADRFNGFIREDLRSLGLSYDLFTRTTTRNHYTVTRDVFRTLYEKGFVVERETLGAFSATTGHTLPDRYIEGTCPICGFESARGDQCDNCGNQLDPTDLINPRSRIDGTPPVFKKTNHLFLDLPAFKEQLTEWIESKEGWRQNVRRFSLNFVRELKPRPITRDLDWGVPIPVPCYEERDDKRIYVWFDAVIGYLSASIEWAANRGAPDAWREWWQDPAAEHTYFMGKDNIVFHTVIWPSMLLGYGSGGEYGAGRGELELPDNVASSEFLTMEGKKFSASRGVQILVGDFLSRYDPDALRYFLTIAGPETQDTDFTWTEFVRRNNDELVATWGNLVNRTLQSAYKNFGAVPTPDELTAEDQALLREIASGFESVGALIEAARFRAALQEAMRLASLGNQYVAEQAPWAKLDGDRERAGTILYVALRAIDSLKVLLTPFLPFSAQRLHKALGYDDVIAGELTFCTVSEGDTEHVVLTGDYESWAGRWEPSALPAGRVLREPKPLFAKLDPERVVEDELARMEAATVA